MADPPREGDGASSMGGTGDESSLPAAAVERPAAENPAPGLGSRFERALGLFRVVVVLPVVVLLLSALASFAYGTVVFIRSVASVVEDAQVTSHNLGFLLLLTDLFLVGATLMIAAFGLYELFIGEIGGGHGWGLPGWLRMHDLNDLKARVISMIILVAAVTFADVAVESRSDLDTLYLGVGVAVVIAALTAFLRFGRIDGSNG